MNVLGVSFIWVALQAIFGFVIWISLRRFISKQQAKIGITILAIIFILLVSIVNNFFSFIKNYEFIIAGIVLGEWLYGKYETNVIFKYLYQLKLNDPEYDGDEEIIITPDEIERIAIYDIKSIKKEKIEKKAKNFKEEYNKEVKKYLARLKVIEQEEYKETKKTK